MVSYALRYAEAAMTLAHVNAQRFANPAYYLAGHSIELSLKAFLMARGTIGIDAFRKAYNHDLEKLMKEARRRKLGRVVKIDRRIDLQLQGLNKEYSGNDYPLKYIRTGLHFFPNLELLTNFAVHLATGLRRYCERATVKTRKRR